MLLPATRNSPTKRLGSFRSARPRVVMFMALACWMTLSHASRGVPSLPEAAQEKTKDPARQTETGVKAVKITPSSVAVAVGEPQVFRLTNDRGQPIRDADWAVSDPSLADIQGDGEIRLVGLAPGKVTVTATWAGLSAQAQARIFEGDGLIPSRPGTRRPGIEITPSFMSVVIDEPRLVRLNDPNGRMIRDAIWSVSDPGVLELQPAAEPVLRGLTPGKVTVTAFWQGQVAEATINVFPGPELPQGTIRWSSPPLPGYSTDGMNQAQPNLMGGPDIFVTEHDGCGHYLVRGLTSDGRELWRKPMDINQDSPAPCSPTLHRPRDAQGPGPGRRGIGRREPSPGRPPAVTSEPSNPATPQDESKVDSTRQ